MGWVQPVAGRYDPNIIYVNQIISDCQLVCKWAKFHNDTGIAQYTVGVGLPSSIGKQAAAGCLTWQGRISFVARCQHDGVKAGLRSVGHMLQFTACAWDRSD